MYVKKRWIKVKTEFRGIHCWPECPYDDVSFLRHPHRHTFKVEVKVEVDHCDRDIEFFRLQHDVDKAINTAFGQDYKEIEPIELGRKSCEDIAEAIGEVLYTQSIYDHGDMVISVSEDGEVAAEIEFEPEG